MPDWLRFYPLLHAGDSLFAYAQNGMGKRKLSLRRLFMPAYAALACAGCQAACAAPPCCLSSWFFAHRTALFHAPP